MNIDKDILKFAHDLRIVRNADANKVKEVIQKRRRELEFWKTVLKYAKKKHKINNAKWSIDINEGFFRKINQIKC